MRETSRAVRRLLGELQLRGAPINRHSGLCAVALATLIACLLVFGYGGGKAGTPATQGNPVPRTYVVWRDPGGGASPSVLPFKVPAKPAKGSSVVDPVYDTPITRVTDRSADKISDPGILNEYARIDPENATGTRALLRASEGNWYLYSVPGYKRLAQIDFRGNPDSEPRWDVANPDTVYFVEGPTLWQRNVATGTDKAVHSFTAQEPKCAFARARYEGEPSRDCRYWAFRLEDESYKVLSVVTYDKQTDQILGRLTTFVGDFDWVGMDTSGSHCVIAYDYPNRGVAFNRGLSRSVKLPAGIGHSDFGVDSAGRDVLVYQNASTDYIAMADLDTGTETNLIAIPFAQNPDIGLHFACAIDKPGWVMVSTYGQNATALSWMDRLLFMVELKARPLVWRIAQTQELRAADDDYFGEAFAAINRRATRIWWGANWNAKGSGAHTLETYVADLPTDWDSQVRSQAAP